MDSVLIQEGEIAQRLQKDGVESDRINALRGSDPFLPALAIGMGKCPGGLRVVERGRCTGELKLLPSFVALRCPARRAEK